jgi:TRAP-type C4-dicarboxylate transport system substrate-binding protein
MILFKRLRTVAVIAVASVLGVACSGGSDTGRNGGGESSGATLTMASGAASPTAWPAVTGFLDRFKELSSGAPVNVVDRWGDFKPEHEQQIVRDVAAGRADVGWVGARVFDTLGVSSLQAWSAPLLVDSYALQQAVIDSEISREVLDDLDAVGVQGLALLAGGLRKPVSVKRPLVRPADWRGARVGTLRSATQVRAIEALGAVPVEVLGPARDDALEAGTLDGFELSLRGYQFNALDRRAPYVAVNVNLWPEMMVLIVNPERFAKLSEQVRGWLEQAARETAARSAELSGGDAAILTQECQLGTRAGVASAADLAGLRDALAPVYARLREDAVTKRLIEQIDQLKRGTRAEPPLVVPAGCDATAAKPGASAPSAASPLVGRWEAASPHPYVIEVTDTVWVQLERRPDGSTEEGWRGTYTVQGSRIALKEIGFGCELEYEMALQGDTLRIKVLRDGPADNPNRGERDLAIQRFIYETAPFRKTT